MRRICLVLAAIAVSASIGFAQQAPGGPYKIIKTAKVGGAGGFDYVFADAAGRRLYIPRSGPGARVTVFNLDTLEPVGEIPNTNARGAAVDPKSGHGFSSNVIAAEYGPPPAGGRAGRGAMIPDSFSILVVGK